MVQGEDVPKNEAKYVLFTFDDENEHKIEDVESDREDEIEGGGHLSSDDEVSGGENEVSSAEEVPPKKSVLDRGPGKRKVKVPERYGYESYTFEPIYAMCTNIGAPRTYEEAMASSEREEWEKAMEEELSAMDENTVWDLVELPGGEKAIGCEWVFSYKYENGVRRYKARLVARGDKQEGEFKPEDVYAPVAQQTTIRTFLSVVNQKKLHMEQCDVKTAFLNGELETPVYMKPPKGLRIKKGCVCRLNKSLYGLRTSSKAWYKKIRELLTSLGLFPPPEGAS